MNKIKLLTGLGCLSLSGVASAALISPTSISAGDANPNLDVPTSGGWRTQLALDGTGLNGPLEATTLHAPTSSQNGGRVLGTGGTSASFVFNLAGPTTIDGLALWNGGEDDRPGNGRTVNQRNQTDRGIQSAEIFTSIDNGMTFVSQGSFNFDREFFNEVGIDLNSTDPVVAPIAAQVRDFSAPVVGVTNVRFDATNFGDTNIINFSEVAFNEVAVVPEPSSVLLGALGLGLMVVRRKR